MLSKGSCQGLDVLFKQQGELLEDLSKGLIFLVLGVDV